MTSRDLERSGRDPTMLRKLLELETSNLVVGFVSGMPSAWAHK